MNQMADLAHVLRYEKPAADWNEALPLGNGRIGAMVFDRIDHERIALNEDTLWSGYPDSSHEIPAYREHVPVYGEVSGQARAACYRKARDLALEGDVAAAEQILQAGFLGPYSQSYLPLGDLWIDLAGGEEAELTQYERRLDLRLATDRLDYEQAAAGQAQRYSRESFVSAPDQLLVLRWQARDLELPPLSVTLQSPLKSSACVQAADQMQARLCLSGEAPGFAAPVYVEMDQPVRYGTEAAQKGMRFVVLLDVIVLGEQAAILQNGQGLSIRGARSVEFRLATRTSFNGSARHPYLDGLDELALAEQDLAQAQAYSYEALLARHQADHAALYQRVQVDLHSQIDVARAEKLSQLDTLGRLNRLAGDPDCDDEALYALLFHYSRYLMIAASRPRTQAMNLQGIWNEHLQAPWSSNYTININTEMNYWGAGLLSLSDCLPPLLTLLEACRPKAEQAARAYYDAPGMVVHHNTDIWGHSDPVGCLSQHSVVWGYWPLGSAWLCETLYEQTQYAPDPVLLSERILPLMAESARFLAEMLVEDTEGQLVFAAMTSPENEFMTPEGQRTGIGRWAALSQELMELLFTHVLAAIDAVEAAGQESPYRQDPLREQLRAALPRLRRPVVIHNPADPLDGTLAEWDQWVQEIEVEHRHTSHLLGLYPGSLYSVEETPELAAACRQSLIRRGDDGTGWALGWKVNLWASLREGDRARKLLRNQLRPVNPQSQKENYQHGGSYPNLLDAHPPFQIDGNFASGIGLARLFVQTRGNQVFLLPALPRDWSTCAISGLTLPGGATLAIEVAQGELLTCRIENPTPSTLVFQIHHQDRRQPLILAPGQVHSLSAADFI